MTQYATLLPLTNKFPKFLGLHISYVSHSMHETILEAKERMIIKNIVYPIITIHCIQNSDQDSYASDCSNDLLESRWLLHSYFLSMWQIQYNTFCTLIWAQSSARIEGIRGYTKHTLLARFFDKLVYFVKSEGSYTLTKASNHNKIPGFLHEIIHH